MGVAKQINGHVNVQSSREVAELLRRASLVTERVTVQPGHYWFISAVEGWVLKRSMPILSALCGKRILVVGKKVGG